MAQQSRPVPEVLQAIKAEYQELPGLCLTKPQMQRLWGMDGVMCDAAIDALIVAHVLRKTTAGMYVALDSPAA